MSKAMPFNLSDLVPNEGSNQKRKRVGRGTGSGHGKTSGRGTKGQKSRSGPGVRAGFEGGQLPIQKRMPYKRGFTNIYKAEWEVVNIGKLDEFELSGEVTLDALYERGVIRGLEFPVKILGSGEITRAINISAHAVSESAKERIEAAGGSVTLIDRTDRWVTARPRSRKLPINSALKKAGFGKVGGITSREELSGN
jgi:large subunit ribosomal protein L15